MLKIKEESGITLLALVVTIIIMVILAGIGLNFGADSITYSRDKQLQAELEMIQQACISEYAKAKDLGYLEKDEKPGNFLGTEVPVDELPTISDELSWVFSSEPEEAYKGYFELTPEQLDDLNIVDSAYTYIVNYYTGEVFNESRPTSEGIPLYIRSVSTHQTEDNTDDTSYTNW